MLSLFKKSLSKLMVYSEDKLKKEYEQEEQRIQSEFVQKEGEEKRTRLYELSELVQGLDVLQQSTPTQEQFNIDELIAKIDAKIAELEREEKKYGNRITRFGEKLKNIMRPKNDINDLISNADAKKTKHQYGGRSKETDTSTAWIIALMPKQDFSIKYNRIYIATLLNELIHTAEGIRSGASTDDWFGGCVNKLPNRSLRNIASLLCNIIVALYNENTEIVKENANKTKLVIRREIRQLTEKSQFTSDDLELMCFFRDALFLVLSISKHTMYQGQDHNWAEARAYINYYLANSFWEKEPAASSEGLLYAKQGLVISDPKDRQDAFNVLGVCAIETRESKQLAYDAYYSWIHQKIVGEIISLLPAEYTFGDEEDVWRCEEEGRKQTAVMYANYSYVCGIIADTYERDAGRWHVFSDIALEQIRKAISIHDVSTYHCTYGTLLSEKDVLDSDFHEVLIQYQKYHDTAKAKTDKLASARCLIATMIDELQSSLYRWSEENSGSIQEWASSPNNITEFRKLIEQLTQYQKVVLGAKDDPHVDAFEKKNPWKRFLKLHDKLASIDASFEIKLLMVEKLSQTIMGLLKRREYSSVNYYTRIDEMDRNVPPQRVGVKAIAYYTTLKTATHLFDVLYRENNHVAPSVVGKDKESQYRDGINCLTMMHAHYMNDPFEGMALADFVSGTDPYSNVLFYRGDAAQFREDIFRQYYVFLKSFTDKMDDLLMWNRYASDRNTGSKDSNGCCVQFNTDFFDKVNDSETSGKNMLLDGQDDYALYRVVYICQDGSIQETKNPGLPSYVQGCYKLLIKLLHDVNGDLRKKGYAAIDGSEKEQTKWVRGFVQSALREVIFLFKHDDYADEAEYRLVVTRPHDFLDGIRLIPSEPDMLCVNPYFQICIDRVILGPNVAKTDPWSIYFQYQMTLMWKRALGFAENNQMPDFVIEKSKIHYHT